MFCILELRTPFKPVSEWGKYVQNKLERLHHRFSYCIVIVGCKKEMKKWKQKHDPILTIPAQREIDSWQLQVTADSVE